MNGAVPEAEAAGATVIPEGLDATLVLLRHGESTYIAEGRFQGQADAPLSPLGLRQAELAAVRLADPARSPVLPIPRRPPLEIVHSPLSRTATTAAAVAAAMVQGGVAAQGGAATVQGGVAAVYAGAPRLRPDPAFLEIAQGSWEGLHREEIESVHAATLAAWRRTPLEANAPGGERIVDVAVRVRDGLGRLLERLAAAPRTARSSTTAGGYPPPVAPDTPWTLLVGHDGVFKVVLLTLLGLPLERFWTFPFAVCGISVVEIRAGTPVLRAHNLTEHLAPLLDQIAVAETEERQRSGAL